MNAFCSSLKKEGERSIVEALLPVGEDAQNILHSIGTYLDQTRRTRMVNLILPQKTGLSRIIAPLIVQNTLLGYLYGDMDSLYGLFTDVDRDMFACSPIKLRSP